MASSFAWSSLENGGAQITQIVVFFIAARILLPEEVGHASLALIITQAFQSIVSTGINAYVVGVPGVDHRSKDTHAFWLSVSIGLSQFIITASICLLCWSVTGRSYFPLLYLTASVANLVVALGIAHQASMTRALLMRSLAIRTLTSVLVAGVCGIGMAMSGFGAYAIVLQTLLQAIIGTSLLWYLSPWRPSKKLDVAGIREVLFTSRHMFSTGVLNFTVGNIDLAIVGWLLGAHAAGVYAVARRALFAFNGLISTALSQVSLSVFTSIRSSDPDQLATRFVSIIGLTSIITVPLFFGLSGLAEPFVRVLFGQRWDEAAPIMAILMPFGALQSLGVYNQSFVIAFGRPDLQTKLAAKYAIITIPLMIVTANLSLTAVALAYTLRGYLTFPMSIALVTKNSSITNRQYLEAIMPAFACAILVFLSMQISQRISPPDPWMKIMTGSVGGIIVYGAFVLTFSRGTLVKLWSLRRAP